MTQQVYFTSFARFTETPWMDRDPTNMAEHYARAQPLEFLD